MAEPQQLKSSEISDTKIIAITSSITLVVLMIILHYTCGAKPLNENIKRPFDQIVKIHQSDDETSLTYLNCAHSNSLQEILPINIENTDGFKDGITSFKPQKIIGEKKLKYKILNWIGDTRLIVLDIENNGKTTHGLVNPEDWVNLQKEACSLEREVANKNINNYKQHLQFQHYIDEK